MTNTTDPREIHQRAMAQTESIVAAVVPAQFGLPTPCPEYDVHTLLSHTVGGLNRIALVGEGADALAIPARPPALIRRARRGQPRRRWGQPGPATGRARPLALLGGGTSPHGTDATTGPLRQPLPLTTPEVFGTKLPSYPHETAFHPARFNEMLQFRAQSRAKWRSVVANAGSVPGRCAACGRALPVRQGPGRVRIYCNASCRSAARRTRQAATWATRRESDVKINLTRPGREGSLYSVLTGTPAGNPPVLSRVIGAARVVLDDVPPDDALTPLAVVAVVRSLARVVEDGMREAVQAARQAGRTWAELGDLLGTTRQAAFQRFGRPLDPRTGAPMADAILPGAAGRAAGLIADVAEQRWEQARAGFDQRMSAALSAQALAAAWAQVIGAAGAYQGMGEPVAHQAGDYTVVDVPLHFEAAELNGRVSFSGTGQVAGLFFQERH
jgi:hypothetical protein